MSLTLAEIRAKLQATEKKSGGNNNNFSGGITYPHWNIEDGQTARIRFLPDANPKNSFFWVEKAMIKLPFAGIKGDSNSKPVIVQVPCIEMFPGYENKCPILAEVRPWYKIPDMEIQAGKYWKKRSYIFQGFVRENPLKEDKAPENPIRRFVISSQIFTLVKAALMDVELENLPTDYQNGLDFSVNKTSKSKYADYSTSKWSRKESPLTSVEVAAIEQYGLANLSDALPKMPTQEELDIMVEMFHASVNGEEYDEAKWGKYFKPSGYNTNDSETEFAAKTESVVVESTPTAVEVVAKSTTTSRAEDILKQIRNRK